MCRCLNQSVKISEAKHWWRQLLTLLVKSRASPALLLQKLVRPSLQVYRSRRKPAVAKKSTFLAWCLRKVKLWLLRNQTLGRKKTKAPPPPWLRLGHSYHNLKPKLRCFKEKQLSSSASERYRKLIKMNIRSSSFQWPENLAQ